MNHIEMYRQLVMKLHPDRGGSLRDMTILNSAHQAGRWEVIADLYAKYFGGAKQKIEEKEEKPLYRYWCSFKCSRFKSAKAKIFLREMYRIAYRYGGEAELYETKYFLIRRYKFVGYNLTESLSNHLQSMFRWSPFYEP